MTPEQPISGSLTTRLTLATTFLEDLPLHLFEPRTKSSRGRFIQLGWDLHIHQNNWMAPGNNHVTSISSEIFKYVRIHPNFASRPVSCEKMFLCCSFPSKHGGNLVHICHPSWKKKQGHFAKFQWIPSSLRSRYEIGTYASLPWSLSIVISIGEKKYGWCTLSVLSKNIWMTNMYVSLFAWLTAMWWLSKAPVGTFCLSIIAVCLLFLLGFLFPHSHVPWHGGLRAGTDNHDSCRTSCYM